MWPHIEFLFNFKCLLKIIFDIFLSGANVNWMDVNNDGLSPIHIAACKGQTEVAKRLIKAGCSVNAQDM